MPDIVTIDWSKVWTGDDMSLVLTATQRAWLLQLVANVFSAPKLFLLPFETSDEAAINEFIELLLSALLDVTIPPKDNMNNRIFLTPINGTVGGGNPLFFTTTGFWLQNAATNGAYYVIEDIRLAPGNWEIWCTVIINNASGILRIDVKDPSGSPSYDADSVDLYNSTTVFPVQARVNQFTLTEEKLVDLTISAFGKHASSSSYQINIQSIQLIRVP